MWKNYVWYYGKTRVTWKKTMVLWNFDLLWKKLWYYGKTMVIWKNYGNMKNYGSMEKLW